MAAAIYARISSDPDGTKPGGGRQLEDCRKLAAERGRPMADDYVDNEGVSVAGVTRVGPLLHRMSEPGRRNHLRPYPVRPV
jgi:DNA invertase Pin-like site-specific DNA recombinase